MNKALFKRNSLHMTLIFFFCFLLYGTLFFYIPLTFENIADWSSLHYLQAISQKDSVLPTASSFYGFFYDIFLLFVTQFLTNYSFFTFLVYGISFLLTFLFSIILYACLNELPISSGKNGDLIITFILIIFFVSLEPTFLQGTGLFLRVIFILIFYITLRIDNTSTAPATSFRFHFFLLFILSITMILFDIRSFGICVSLFSYFSYKFLPQDKKFVRPIIMLFFILFIGIIFLYCFRYPMLLIFPDLTSINILRNTIKLSITEFFHLNTASVFIMILGIGACFTMLKNQSNFTFSKAITPCFLLIALFTSLLSYALILLIASTDISNTNHLPTYLLPPFLLLGLRFLKHWPYKKEFSIFFITTYSATELLIINFFDLSVYNSSFNLGIAQIIQSLGVWVNLFYLLISVLLFLVLLKIKYAFSSFLLFLGILWSIQGISPYLTVSENAISFSSTDYLSSLSEDSFLSSLDGKIIYLYSTEQSGTEDIDNILYLNTLYSNSFFCLSEDAFGDNSSDFSDFYFLLKTDSAIFNQVYQEHQLIYYNQSLAVFTLSSSSLSKQYPRITYETEETVDISQWTTNKTDGIQTVSSDTISLHQGTYIYTIVIDSSKVDETVAYYTLSLNDEDYKNGLISPAASDEPYSVTNLLIFAEENDSISLTINGVDETPYSIISVSYLYYPNTIQIGSEDDIELDNMVLFFNQNPTIPIAVCDSEDSQNKLSHTYLMTVIQNPDLGIRNAEDLLDYSEYDFFVIAKKEDASWFQLLSKFVILAYYDNYLVLAPSNSNLNNSNIFSIYSEGEHINMNIFTEKKEQSYIANRYSIPKGVYEITLELSPHSMLSSIPEDVIVQIYEDKDLISEISCSKASQLIIPAFYHMNEKNISIKVKTLDGKQELPYYPKYLRPLAGETAIDATLSEDSDISSVSICEAYEVSITVSSIEQTIEDAAFTVSLLDSYNNKIVTQEYTYNQTDVLSGQKELVILCPSETADISYEISSTENSFVAFLNKIQKITFPYQLDLSAMDCINAVYSAVDASIYKSSGNEAAITSEVFTLPAGDYMIKCEYEGNPDAFSFDAVTANGDIISAASYQIEEGQNIYTLPLSLEDNHSSIYIRLLAASDYDIIIRSIYIIPD